jgi:hypothetical protein
MISLIISSYKDSSNANSQTASKNFCGHLSFIYIEFDLIFQYWNDRFFSRSFHFKEKTSHHQIMTPFTCNFLYMYTFIALLNFHQIICGKSLKNTFTRLLGLEFENFINLLQRFWAENTQKRHIITQKIKLFLKENLKKLKLKLIVSIQQ